MDEVGRIFNQLIQDDVSFAKFLSVSPSYRYYNHQNSKDRYFWTTETVTHKRKQRYASGIYRYIKMRKAFKLTQERYHAKRKDAKARALQLYNRDLKQVS